MSTNLIRHDYYGQLIIAIERKLESGQFSNEIIDDYNKVVLALHQNLYFLEEEHYRTIRQLVMYIWGQLPQEPNYIVLDIACDILRTKLSQQELEKWYEENFAYIHEMLQ